MPVETIVDFEALLALYDSQLARATEQKLKAFLVGTSRSPSPVSA